MRAFVVAGLGFGDEGKGTLTDYLVRRHGARLVVRYGGGPQAAHRVVTPGGRVHVFAQLGSGAFVDGVRTHLAAPMIVDPPALFAEVAALAAAGVPGPFDALSIDPACVLLTPWHQGLGRLRELARGPARHGSCGRGVAEARLDSENPGLPTLRLADTTDPWRLRARLRFIQATKVDQAEQLVDRQPDRPDLQAGLVDLRRPDRLEPYAQVCEALLARVTLTAAPPLPPVTVFEGAQGALLDRDHGFWPHVTPSRATFADALALLAAWAPDAHVTRVGVLRAYHTRHGAGPLPTEDPALTAALPDADNADHPWQGAFRVGWFDAVLARYALACVGGVDRLVVTCLDRLADHPAPRLCDAYALGDRRLTDLAPASDPADRDALTASLRAVRPLLSPAPDLLAAIAQALGRPVDLASYGPTATDKRELTE